MKRVILTIAIVLCAASAFAGDHRGDDRDGHDNGHHYGQYWKHDSHREHGCRGEREWRPRHVAYRPEYREVRELPARYVVYRPEYRYEQPRVAIALPAVPFALSVVFR